MTGLQVLIIYFPSPRTVWKVVVTLSGAMTESEIFVSLVTLPFLCLQLPFF